MKLYAGLVGLCLLASIGFSSCAQSTANHQLPTTSALSTSSTASAVDILENTKISTEKMKIEVWSDIVCPFCYIGKRHYEKALAETGLSDKIELVWRSFQLDPEADYDQASKSKKSYESFAEKKGIPVAQAKQMFDQVNTMAQKAGLNYNFDIAINANTEQAHLLLQKAKEKGLGDAMKERLLKAYFMDGKDLEHEATLIELGKEVGLTAEEVKAALTDKTYADKLKADLKQAQEYGIGGVPFFVVDGKYGINGAQPVDVFKQTLQGAYAEWEKANADKPKLKVIDGQSCKPDGKCD